MRTIRTKVYQFNELSDKAKGKAIDSFRDVNVNDNDWYSFVYEKHTAKLTELGFSDIDISFRGFWSQGDGASFTGKLDVLTFIEKSGYVGAFKKSVFGLIKAGKIEISASIIRTNHHYVHERSTGVDIDIFMTGERCSDFSRLSNYLHYKLESLIGNEIITLNKSIYKDLEEEHESLTSDDSVISTIEANEYEFTQEGRQF